MSEFTVQDVRRHLTRLANTRDNEYLAERKMWDENSIQYAWAFVDELAAATNRYKALKQQT